MDFLKSKRFRYGTFSIIFLLLAFVLFVFVNLFADRFNYTRDLTREQIFTLTDHSRNFLAELDEDIHITLITRLGQGHPDIFPILDRLLAEYATASRHITVEHRDPTLNPALIHEFAQRADHIGGIPDESVIVESNRSLQILTPSDMVDVNRNIFGQVVSYRSFNFEPAITRAIHRLTQTESLVVYYVTGSGEIPFDPELANFLQAENFDTREVNLLVGDVPADADILIIPMPSRDWTRDKADRVLTFLENGGRALFALDFSPVEMPVLRSVLEAYGLTLGQYIIFEGSPGNMLQSPLHLLPNNTDHEIFENINRHNMLNLLIGAVEIGRAPVQRNTLSFYTLWYTSDSAFGRAENSDSVIQLPSDIPGPFELAVAVTDHRFVNREPVTTQIVVVGNTAVMIDIISELIGGGNNLFVRDSLNWLAEHPPTIFIPGRIPPGSAPVMLTGLQSNVMSVVVLGLIPVGLLAIGLVIWLRRRHK